MTAEGGCAVIPSPPQRWGVLSICKEAAALIVQANLTYSVMVEGRLDFNGGLEQAIRDGGRRLGFEAHAAMADLPPNPLGAGNPVHLEAQVRVS